METVSLPDGFDVEFHDFCGNCPDLQVCQHSIEFLVGLGVEYCHTISCENYKKCANISEKIKDAR